MRTGQWEHRNIEQRNIEMRTGQWEYRNIAEIRRMVNNKRDEDGTMGTAEHRDEDGTMRTPKHCRNKKNGQ